MFWHVTNSGNDWITVWSIFSDANALIHGFLVSSYLLKLLFKVQFKFKFCGYCCCQSCCSVKFKINFWHKCLTLMNTLGHRKDENYFCEFNVRVKFVLEQNLKTKRWTIDRRSNQSMKLKFKIFKRSFKVGTTRSQFHSVWWDFKFCSRCCSGLNVGDLLNCSYS